LDVRRIGFTPTLIFKGPAGVKGVVGFVPFASVAALIQVVSARAQ